MSRIKRYQKITKKVKNIPKKKNGDKKQRNEEYELVYNV